MTAPKFKLWLVLATTAAVVMISAPASAGGYDNSFFSFQFGYNSGPSYIPPYAYGPFPGYYKPYAQFRPHGHYRPRHHRKHGWGHKRYRRGHHYGPPRRHVRRHHGHRRGYR